MPEKRMVKRPVVEAGRRRDPPISVPTPRGLPYEAMRADSPPEEPPGVRLRLRGFVVLRRSTSALIFWRSMILRSENIINGLCHHHGCWYIGFYVDNGSKLDK